MRVLLISPNREHLPDPAFPLGLAYVAAALKRHGHLVRALDLCFADDPEHAIAGDIAAFRPEIIGMSLRNIDDVAYPKKHSYLRDYQKAMAAVRKYTGVPVVLGGSGFTIMPGAFMRELGADFGIAGEGERAFPRLLKDISSDRQMNGRLVRAARSMIGEIDGIVPDRGLFDTAAYYRLGGMLNIQTKRGCPFSCIYCTYPAVEGRRMRLRSPDAVADEFEEVMEQTGARHFFIVDSVFNYPATHAAAVCDEIIRRNLHVTWSCYASPAYMSGGLADAMAHAGCTGVEFGTDSLEDSVLRNLGKNFTARKVRKASDICRSSGLKFCHFVFAGAPGDTEETVKVTMERLEELQPDAAVVMTGIRIFPGTVLADLARHDLGIPEPALEPVFYLSPQISDYDSIREDISQKRNWVMPGYEINIHSRLQRRLRESGIKGPLWENISKKR